MGEEMKEDYKIIKTLKESRFRELCHFFDSKQLEEFTLIEGEMEIYLKKEILEKHHHIVEKDQGDPELTITTPSVAKVEEEPVLTGNVVSAVVAGTFYSAPSPTEGNFVNIGDKVKKGDKLGIIEVMKVMNVISSPYAGVVKDILIGNGDAVKQGDPIFVIK